MRGRPSRGGLGLRGFMTAGLLGLACLAHAQTSTGKEGSPPKLPGPLTREAIRELVARLSDTEVRQFLIAQLDRAAAPAPPSPPAGGVMGMVDDMTGASQRMAELAAGVAALPGVLLDVRARFLEGRGPGQLLLVALVFAVMLAAGVLVERLVERGLRGVRRSLVDGPGEGLAGQAGRLVVRLVLACTSATTGGR